jgi:hypothetical protein
MIENPELKRAPDLPIIQNALLKKDFEEPNSFRISSPMKMNEDKIAEIDVVS